MVSGGQGVIISIAVSLLLLLTGFAYFQSAETNTPVYQMVNSINAISGVLKLLNNDSSITINTGISHLTVTLNVANANIWTAIQSDTLAWDAKLAAGDANPASRLGQDNFGAVFFGQGGTHALDMEIVWSSNGQLDIKPSVTNESPTVRFAASGSGTNPRFDFYHGQAAGNVEFMSVGWGLTGSDFSLKESQNGGTLQDFEINMGGTQMMVFHSNAGDVTPGSDNTINIGTNSLRFKLVRAVTITSGDINFWPNPCGINQGGTIVNPPGCNPAPLYTLTEAPNGGGLILVNHVTGQNSTVTTTPITQPPTAGKGP